MLIVMAVVIVTVIEAEAPGCWPGRLTPLRSHPENLRLLTPRCQKQMSKGCRSALGPQCPHPSSGSGEALGWEQIPPRPLATRAAQSWAPRRRLGCRLCPRSIRPEATSSVLRRHQALGQAELQGESPRQTDRQTPLVWHLPPGGRNTG